MRRRQRLDNDMCTPQRTCVVVRIFMADLEILIATFTINDGVVYNTYGFNHLGHRNVSSEETAELS